MPPRATRSTTAGKDAADPADDADFGIGSSSSGEVSSGSSWSSGVSSSSSSSGSGASSSSSSSGSSELKGQGSISHIGAMAKIPEVGEKLSSANYDAWECLLHDVFYAEGWDDLLAAADQERGRAEIDDLQRSSNRSPPRCGCECRVLPVEVSRSCSEP